MTRPNTGATDRTRPPFFRSAGLLVLALTYLAVFNPGFAHAATSTWARHVGTSHSDYSNAVAAHGSGVYVAGYTEGGTFPWQTSSGGVDAFVRKYSLDGRLLWTRQFGTSGSDHVYGIAVDDSGVYVGGETSGTLPWQSFSGGSTDAFVRKYSHGGALLWTRQFGTSGDEYVSGLAVDGSAIYVAGYVTGTLPWQTPRGSADAFVRKYDRDGRMLWTRQFGTKGVDYARGVAADDSGVYVTGRTFPYGNLGGPDHSGSGDAFVRMYSPDGTPQWTRQFETGRFDSRVTSIAVGTSGVYVVGSTWDTLPGQTSAGGYDPFVRKYDLAGVELWTRQFGTSSNDYGEGVAADSSGAYVTGFTGGTFAGQTSRGFEDRYVRRYGQDGTLLSTRQVGTSNYDRGAGIAVDGEAVYISGDTRGTFPWQTYAGGFTDAFVMKLNK